VYFEEGQPILAARSGEVIRVDHSYVEYTTEEREADLAIIIAEGNDPEILDHLRGRQVWISHDDGNTTRYCHLSSVVSSLSVGQQVGPGETIAGAGNSGTNGAAGTGMDIHLHFELRLGDPYGPYLGQGESVSEVRRLYNQVFSTD
jgi:murein DD-endopeptidase MepM/ murein hydrolase activator NlpD